MKLDHHIVIAGSSGFVGQNLIKVFSNKGFKVKGIDRETIHDKEALAKIVKNADVIINLSGASILQRWDEAYKKVLYSSRIETTKKLVQAINQSKKEQLFISTSAIGIYQDEVKSDEYTTQLGNDFLSHLCKEWEKEARKVAAHKRLVLFRYGIVLGEGGGALSKMLTPFKLGLGGNVGSGKQAFSFIAMHDLVEAYLFVIHNLSCEGIYNLTTPVSTDNKTFSQSLAKKLKRPAFFHMPTFLVKLILGEGATLLLHGQNVYPKRLIEQGFDFKFTTIDAVLDHYV